MYNADRFYYPFASVYICVNLIFLENWGEYA
jgi:hypothetical protein